MNDDLLRRLEIIEAQILLILQSLRQSGHPCPDLSASIERTTPTHQCVWLPGNEGCRKCGAPPPAPTQDDKNAAHDEYGVTAGECEGDPGPPITDE